MTEDFDVNSPRGVTTRDGRKVMIYCTNVPGVRSIHGRLDDDHPKAWKSNGRYNLDETDSSYDLINPPAPVERIDRKVWVNFYPTENFVVHLNENSAQSSASSNCRRIGIPCRLVEIVEGEE